ncbi:MAG: hypothetical protein K2H70_01885 [Bacteroidales bacterium]|nr:hypothetical protein [Bacteroidales bacterium]
MVVTFAETVAETDSMPNRPELKSGSRLGLLMWQIRKWFDELKDLKALAFGQGGQRGFDGGIGGRIELQSTIGAFS